ncbi:MAG: putative DNA binding domain-containing protein [Methanomicrobiaceae archaeon]|nr:putative DNA binding domain-containing protein [Methanomicrobiaceae archaeon]
MTENMPGKLKEFMNLPSETEWIEFKEAKEDYDFEKLGRLFSALSNEANLNGEDCGWLIFGVTDKLPRNIVGTNYRKTAPGLERLKPKIAEQTNHRMTFSGIHEFQMDDKRVIMFEIPPATRGIPTTWKGNAFGRVHESLESLTLNEIERIRNQNGESDWSAEICRNASLSDLDSEAVLFAREKYREKNPSLSDEIDKWNDEEFLNRAKVCIEGKVTNAAIILLGKNESEHFISPAISQITWILKDNFGIEKDYQHFGPPFIIAVDKVYSKIRNLTYRYIANETLFPTEVSQYDSYVIRETLNNCIAHQDYKQCTRIQVIEEPDALLFTNRGDFLPGSVENVIISDSPPDFYRNRFLANAMVNLNMIDTIGSGIKRIFKHQRDRNFPMPDYDLKDSGLVKIRIFGKILNENYTRLLIQRRDLDIMDIIALDKIQKKQSLSNDEIKRLRSKKLIEGRKPIFFISEYVAKKTNSRAEYIRNRSFDKNHFKDMIVEYLKKFDEAKYKDFEDLIFDKLSDALDEKQKKHFIRNILQEMRKENVLSTKGYKKGTSWILSKKDQS